jgi:hypothetical protein
MMTLVAIDQSIGQMMILAAIDRSIGGMMILAAIDRSIGGMIGSDRPKYSEKSLFQCHFGQPHGVA